MQKARKVKDDSLVTIKTFYLDIIEGLCDSFPSVHIKEKSQVGDFSWEITLECGDEETARSFAEFLRKVP